MSTKETKNQVEILVATDDLLLLQDHKEAVYHLRRRDRNFGLHLRSTHFTNRATSPKQFFEHPDEAILWNATVLEGSYGLWRYNTRKQAYEGFCIWSPDQAKTRMEKHYIREVRNPERHLWFKQKGGYRKLEKAETWDDWLKEFWPETRDSWWDIGYRIRDEYVLLLEDIRAHYN